MFLDVGITANERAEKGMTTAFNLKLNKYSGEHCIRFEGDKEIISDEPARFIPLLFTSTGLYKPSLFRDLRNILKLPVETTKYLLRKLSALAIRGSRYTYVSYQRISAAAKTN